MKFWEGGGVSQRATQNGIEERGWWLFPQPALSPAPNPPSHLSVFERTRLVLEISGPYKHEHLSLINLGGKSIGKDKPRRRSSLAEQLRLSLSYSTGYNIWQSNAVYSLAYRENPTLQRIRQSNSVYSLSYGTVVSFSQTSNQSFHDANRFIDYITQMEIDLALSHGKSTAPGEDGITYQVIRHLNSNICDGINPIRLLFTAIYREGVLPWQ